jgi:hypothetical protein
MTIRYPLQPISAEKMIEIQNLESKLHGKSSLTSYPAYWCPEMAFNPEAFDPKFSWIYPLSHDNVKVVVDAGDGYDMVGRPSSAYFEIE